MHPPRWLCWQPGNRYCSSSVAAEGHSSSRCRSCCHPRWRAGASGCRRRGTGPWNSTASSAAWRSGSEWELDSSVGSPPCPALCVDVPPPPPPDTHCQHRTHTQTDSSGHLLLDAAGKHKWFPALPERKGITSNSQAIPKFVKIRFWKQLLLQSRENAAQDIKAATQDRDWWYLPFYYWTVEKVKGSFHFLSVRAMCLVRAKTAALFASDRDDIVSELCT